MSNSGFSYSSRHSYSSRQSYSSPQSYMGSAGSGGYDGQDPNPLLTQALASTREHLLNQWGADDRNGPDKPRLQPQAMPADPDAAAAVTEARRRLARCGRDIRASLYQSELSDGLAFEMENGVATLTVGPAKTVLIQVAAPYEGTFVRQLARVQDLAPLRDARAPEILAQVTPPTAFFASLMFMQQGRHPKTQELIETALAFSYSVCMRFKLALDAPRPSELSSMVLPMLEVPQHQSFPAGHAFEAHVTAAVLGAVSGAQDRQRKMLRALAARISENRIVAGLHYPVDCAAGRAMGDALAAYFLALCGHVGDPDDNSAWQPCDFSAADAMGDLVFANAPSKSSKPGPVGTAARPLLQALWSQAVAEWPLSLSNAQAAPPVAAL